MIWFAYFITGFLLLRLTVSLSNLACRQWLRPGMPVGNPLVSVLIPARNEEKKIGTLLDELIRQNYSNTEILVYDDSSSDRTASLTEVFQNKDKRIKLFRGSDLPDGWLGKNNACHQLSLRASGEYLLFIDADVTVKPGLLKNALSHMQVKDLDLLSIFPKQIMFRFGEKVTVPVMNWVLTGLLPLILTRIPGWPSFSAANGQFMMFRAEKYHMYRFHEQVKAHSTEDIEIFRLMKKMGLATQTLLSNGEISCRMYGSFNEAIKGFSKNVLHFFGGHTLPAVLFAIITGAGFIPVVLYLPGGMTLIYFIMIILHRTVISLISRQSVIENILLAPFQIFSFWLMIASAIIHRRKKYLDWKGRNIYLNGMNIPGQ